MRFCSNPGAYAQHVIDDEDLVSRVGKWPMTAPYFNPDRVMDLIVHSEITPAVNQVVGSQAGGMTENFTVFDYVAEATEKKLAAIVRQSRTEPRDPAQVI